MRPHADRTIAGIDVGANAIRLEMGRPLSDGSIEIVHEERDPLRPGQGLFKTGVISSTVIERLISTMQRYAALCRRHGAQVRVVGTSAVREAANREDVVRRIKQETGLTLEVISGQEEARLVCLGVLAGRRPDTRSVCVDIGGGSTEVVTAVGDRPANLWSLAIGAVRLTEMFRASGTVKPAQLKVMREYADEVIAEGLPRTLPGFPRVALGSSGTIRALIGFVGAAGTAHATARQLERAVDELVRLGSTGRKRQFDPQRAEIIVAGAIILEALVRRLRLKGVTAVERGLRHGVLVDLIRRSVPGEREASLLDAAMALGRRFQFDEAHARQVTTLSLTLFDELTPLHRLPRSARAFLEVAAVLHDIGNALSYTRHHRHSEYLIRNTDIPGLVDRERDLVARIARYHRRSPPEHNHPGMEGLSRDERLTVRKLATLLRIADALDRSHLQAVRRMHVVRRPRDVSILLAGRGVFDLELWDAGREAALFRRVFGRRLSIEAERRKLSPRTPK